jgi:hypothetical protein
MQEIFQADLFFDLLTCRPGSAANRHSPRLRRFARFVVGFDQTLRTKSASAREIFSGRQTL